MSQITQLSFEEQLKNDPKLKESDIKSLREWCQKEPHLPKICDNSLAIFLHRNYYHIESTKTHIDNYYTLRTHTPEFFSNRDTLHCPILRHIFNVVCITPLQQLTKAGHNIVFAKLIDTDASKFHFVNYARYILTVFDLCVYRSGSTKGRAVVLDVQDITLGHAAHCSPFAMKKYMYYVQEGLPARLKELHFVNVNHGMEAILKISKPLMKKETLEILHIHHSLKTLKKFVSIEALPDELGGKAGPLRKLHDDEIKELEKHRNWFLEEEARSRVDESKRPGKGKSSEDFFGVEGSFKKLDVD